MRTRSRFRRNTSTQNNRSHVTKKYIRTFLALADERAGTRSLAVTIFVLSMVMAISMAGTALGQQWVKNSYYVQHNFTLTPGGTIVPDVNVNYFAHAWVQEDNHPNSPCQDCAVEPAQTIAAWECWPDPTGVLNVARDAFVAPHSVKHTGTGGLTIFPQIGVANIPSLGASATINATVPTTCVFSNAEATSYYSVDPFGAGTQIIGTIRSEGYAEFNTAHDSAVSYAFSFADITVRGGQELLSGEIEWYETVRDSAPVSGHARSTSDPIEFFVKDLVTNQILEGTLLSISWKVLQDHYAGGFTWENSTVSITVPAGEFVYDLTSPYTVQQGYLRLRIEGGQVVTSEDSGFLDGVLPAVGTPVPLSFSLVNQTVFDYDLGDFDGHPVEVTLDLGGAGGTGDPAEACCIGTRGTIRQVPDCDEGDQIVDVGDLTNLIDYLHINFTPLCCLDEGDFSPQMYGGAQDGVIDGGDLTGLIDYLFISFTPLPACP